MACALKLLPTEKFPNRQCEDFNDRPSWLNSYSITGVTISPPLGPGCRISLQVTILPVARGHEQAACSLRRIQNPKAKATPARVKSVSTPILSSAFKVGASYVFLSERRRKSRAGRQRHVQTAAQLRAQRRGGGSHPANCSVSLWDPEVRWMHADQGVHAVRLQINCRTDVSDTPASFVWLGTKCRREERLHLGIAR